MKTETNSLVDRLMFYAFIAATVVFAGAALSFFIQAYRLSVANATPRLEAPEREEYAKTQEELLRSGGWADDRALGGEAGETKPAEKLGLKKTPITTAMATVREELQKGQWAPLQLTDAQRETLDRLAMGGVTPEAILAAKNNPQALQSGEQVYQANCVACHGPQGGGNIGPNLTDDYYIHGKGPIATYKVISQGVAAKGMPAWTHLGEEKMKEVTAYVLSLYGKNVEGKAPQGVDAQGNPPPTATGG